MNGLCKRVSELEGTLSKIAHDAGVASCSFDHARWHQALVGIIAKCEKAGFDILGEPKRDLSKSKAG